MSEPTEQEVKDILEKLAVMEDAALKFAEHSLACQVCRAADTFATGEYCKDGDKLWHELMRSERVVMDLEAKLEAMGIDLEECKTPGFEFKGREGN